MKATRCGWRRVLAAIGGVAALMAVAPRACAESFRVTSSPAGAAVEIDGAVVGTTPFQVDYPGGYFHKTHTVFSARLEHRMVRGCRKMVTCCSRLR
jgi:PEGA domain